MCEDESDDEFVAAVAVAIGTTSPGPPEPSSSAGVERVDLYSREDTNLIFNYTPDRTNIQRWHNEQDRMYLDRISMERASQADAIRLRRDGVITPITGATTTSRAGVTSVT